MTALIIYMLWQLFGACCLVFFMLHVSREPAKIDHWSEPYYMPFLIMAAAIFWPVFMFFIWREECKNAVAKKLEGN